MKLYLKEMKEVDFNLIFKRICSSLSITQSLKDALESLEDCFDADGCFINIYDKDTREVRFLGLVEKNGRVSNDITVSVPNHLFLRKETLLLVQDVKDDPFTAYVMKRIGLPVGSFMMMTLELDGTHLGVIAFFSYRYDHFTRYQLTILKELHNPFALITNNAISSILLSKNRSLVSQNRMLQSRINASDDTVIRSFVSRTPSLEAVVASIKKVASFDTTVLILGETGTGKEVIANLVHQLSERRNAPFVKINCGAIPENLIDAQLFGYEKGAFTDAHTQHKGIFEQADTGTILLDEVGELSLASQVRLLRVIQQKKLRRLGGKSGISVDCRIIAATHRDLAAMVQEGTFREDLYYRLNVYPVQVPPLRERQSDIRTLIQFFLDKLCGKYGISQKPKVEEFSIEEAMRYPWPGNVRELENTLERSLLVSDKKNIVLKFPSGKNKITRTHYQEKTTNPMDFESFQKNYFLSLLSYCKGKISGPRGAAEIAKMNPNTLRSRLEKLNIPFKSGRQN